ncbi:MAG: hypothetical protein ACR2KZ_04450 [Segetibacter sp.]
MNDIQPEKSEIKTMFLNGGKTQFEFLKFILTPRELQLEKPFVLIALVQSRLDLDKEAFKPKSFRQWLKRYRNTKPLKSTPVDSAPIAQVVEEAENSKFQFTDSSLLKKEQKPVLQFIKP